MLLIGLEALLAIASGALIIYLLRLGVFLPYTVYGVLEKSNIFVMVFLISLVLSSIATIAYYTVEKIKLGIKGKWPKKNKFILTQLVEIVLITSAWMLVICL
jgi:hypothetical protein